MIIDSLKNGAKVAALNPYFAKVFEYVNSHDLASAEPGKIEIDGKNVWINVVETAGKTPDAARMETHRDYIDIQMLFGGSETFGWKDASTLESANGEYNEVKDITFFADKPTTYFTLQPGQFAIFFPEDGHAPAISNGTIKKAIAKVRVVK